MGIVAVFVVNENSSISPEEEEEEAEWNKKDESQCQELKSLASFWIVKPGLSSKGIQRGITKKRWKSFFSQLLDTIHKLAPESERNKKQSEYSSVLSLS